MWTFRSLLECELSLGRISAIVSDSSFHGIDPDWTDQAASPCWSMRAEASTLDSASNLAGSGHVNYRRSRCLSAFASRFERAQRRALVDKTLHCSLRYTSMLMIISATKTIEARRWLTWMSVRAA